ncbi:hypothetical protein [Hymenobacter norwichensis]|uniref:hypothetical protein n=1 Tax=Hymenobacter norwichensis TaxID=223903 RepID=UPI0003B72B48|nr:hypothetical protein [Hymenobacter norwichensis]
MTSLPPHSPAELLLLLAKHHNPNLRQLLRVTFLDLLRQQVLAIRNEPGQPHPRDPVTWQQYIVSGPALRTHAALPHEKLLINAFRAEDQLRIPFKQYVHMVFEQARTASEYYKLIEANARTGQLFSQHWFWSLINTRYLTREGQQLQDAVEAELVRLDKEVKAQTAQNPANSYQLMSLLGGAFFLLPSYTSETSSQLERELHQLHEPRDNTSTDFGGTTDSGTSWHAHGTTFDSHCPSHGDSDNSSGGGGDNSSGDSGCGGDSGCSGCGGCGGD